MTKKIGEQDHAKQRMREYLTENNISFAQAEIICGYKRGFLSAGGTVGSDKLAMFTQAYPDSDMYYIVTGSRGDPRLETARRLIDELKTKSSELAKNLKALDVLVTNMVTKKQNDL